MIRSLTERSTMFTRPRSSAVPDTPEVERVEKKIGADLAELERVTGGEVKDLDLEDMVSTDEAGRPVIEKAVDVKLQQRPARRWSK